MNKEDLKKQVELLVKDDERNQQTIINQREEIERLKNIIKEVREYCKNDDNFQILDLYSQDIVDGIQKELLEILDKGKEQCMNY